MIRVAIPTHLESYTKGVREVEGHGATLAEVLADLDARFPGMRFRIIDEQDRIRPHIKLFVGQEVAPSPDTPIAPDDLITIVAALSGG